MASSQQVEIEFRGDSKSAVGAIQDQIDAIKDQKDEMRRAARAFQKASGSQLKQLKSIGKTSKETGNKTEDAFKKPIRPMKRLGDRVDKIRQKMRGLQSSMNLNTAVIGIGMAGRAMGSLSRTITGVINKFGEFRNSTMSAFHDARDATRQWEVMMTSLGFRLEKVGKQVSGLARNTIHTPDVIQGVQSTLAPSFVGDEKRLLAATRTALNTSAGTGQNQKTIAEKFAEIKAGQSLGPEFLRFGVTAPELARFNNEIDQGKKRDELEKKVAQINAKGFKSDADLKIFEQLRQTRDPGDTAQEVIDLLGKRFEGAASKKAEERGDLMLGNQVTALRENFGSAFFQQMEPLFSSLAGSLSRINDTLVKSGDIMGTLSGALGAAGDFVKKLKEGTSLNPVEQALKDSFSNLFGGLTNVLEGALKSLFAVLKEGFRVGSLYIEDGLAPIIRALPMMGDFKSRLESQHEFKMFEKDPEAKANFALKFAKSNAKLNDQKHADAINFAHGSNAAPETKLKVLKDAGLLEGLGDGRFSTEFNVGAIAAGGDLIGSGFKQVMSSADEIQYDTLPALGEQFVRQGRDRVVKARKEKEQRRRAAREARAARSFAPGAYETASKMFGGLKDNDVLSMSLAASIAPVRGTAFDSKPGGPMGPIPASPPAMGSPPAVPEGSLSSVNKRLDKWMANNVRDSASRLLTTVGDVF